MAGGHGGAAPVIEPEAVGRLVAQLRASAQRIQMQPPLPPTTAAAAEPSTAALAELMPPDGGEGALGSEDAVVYEGTMEAPAELSELALIRQAPRPQRAAGHLLGASACLSTCCTSAQHCASGDQQQSNMRHISMYSWSC